MSQAQAIQPEAPADLELQKRLIFAWLDALRSGKYAVEGSPFPDLAQIHIERMAKRISIVGECWEYDGALNGDGYPYQLIGKVQARVNRLVAFLRDKSLPADSVVCHSCDNRKCINPAHLWVGTLTDNNRDRKYKGRNRDQRGEKNNMAKLRAEQVKQIFQMRESGMFHRDIAKKFGVCAATIGFVLSGQHWGHVSQQTSPAKGQPK